MLPSHLSFLAFQFIKAVDEGKSITLEELGHDLDHAKDIFQILKDKFPDTFDFSTFEQHDKEFLIDQFADIHFATGPKIFGIDSNGLGALLAYTLELMQRERRVLTEKGYDFQIEMNPSEFSGRDDTKV